jgi:hypothetical protein
MARIVGSGQDLLRLVEDGSATQATIVYKRDYNSIKMAKPEFDTPLNSPPLSPVLGSLLLVLCQIPSFMSDNSHHIPKSFSRLFHTICRT